MSVTTEDFVAHDDEDEIPASSPLVPDIDDRRIASCLLADPERPVEHEAAARPHASRQFDRRQEAAAHRMAIATDFGLPRQWNEVQPVPERGQRVSGARCGGMVERCRERRGRRPRDQIVLRLRSSDPRKKGFDIDAGIDHVRSTQ